MSNAPRKLKHCLCLGLHLGTMFGLKKSSIKIMKGRFIKMNLKLLSILTLLSLSATGCATKTAEREIDRRLAMETPVKTNAELREQTQQSIDSATGITDEQRAKLYDLRDSTRAQMNSLQEESLKLRSMLIKDVLAKTDYDEEIKVIKKRLGNNSKKRLDVVFKALDQAKEILGTQVSKNSPFLNELFYTHHGEF